MPHVIPCITGGMAMVTLYLATRPALSSFHRQGTPLSASAATSANFPLGLLRLLFRLVARQASRRRPTSLSSATPGTHGALDAIGITSLNARCTCTLQVHHADW